MHLAGQTSMNSTTVEEEILAILSHPEFTKDILAALNSDIPDGLPVSEHEAWRRARFTEMIHRVAKDVRSHPRRDLLYQVILDDAKMTNDEIVELFNFIYFYLVNQFKGELAELLARPILHAFHAALVEARLAPPHVRIVPGCKIAARRAQRRRAQSGWYKSADALLIAAPDEANVRSGHRSGDSARPGFTVVAAVEIKSYRANRTVMLKQLGQHISRMRLGVQVSGEEIDPNTIIFLIPERDGRMVCASLKSRTVGARLTTLAVRPSSQNRPAKPLDKCGGRGWMAELNPSTAELTEAGYRFADWFLGRYGPEVFVAPSSGSSFDATERRPNPWPHLSLEEAGRMAFRQAMYSISLRRLFHVRTRHSSVRLRRARETFFWLYNSMCYGYANASGDRLHWPEEHPDLPRAPAGTAKPGQIVVNPTPSAWIEPHISKARKAWSDGKLTEATRLLQAAIAKVPSLAQERKVRWLKAMIALRKEDFAEAEMHFPGPEPAARDFWWTRDVAMSARLSARMGRSAEARKILAALKPLEQWPHRALPVEFHAVAALACLVDGNQREANRELKTALQNLEVLRQEYRQHEEQGLGEPSFVHPATLHLAILDLAAVLAATGHKQKAADELTTLGGLDGWEFAYIARDPLLASLRNNPKLRRQLARWRRAEFRER